jgi:hypothetical protein
MKLDTNARTIAVWEKCLGRTATVSVRGLLVSRGEGSRIFDPRPTDITRDHEAILMLVKHYGMSLKYHGAWHANTYGLQAGVSINQSLELAVVHRALAIEGAVEDGTYIEEAAD